MLFIDTHIHVSDISPSGDVRDDLLTDLLDVLDRSDHDLRFIISNELPHVRRMADDPAAMMKGNRLIHDLVQRAPDRLYGSCTINPDFPDESLRVMETCFEEWGFVQLGEMLPYIMGFRMDSDASERCVRAAVDYGVPVQVHTGTYWCKGYENSTDGMDHLRDLLHCMDRVPEANYIMAHAIGCGPTPAYVPWAHMFLDTLAGVFGAHPRNLWLEIRDFHQADILQRALRDVPADRLLTGTDWTTRFGPPFPAYGTVFNTPEQENPFPPTVDSFVSFLRDSGADEETIAKIAHENAMGLCGIEA